MLTASSSMIDLADVTRSLLFYKPAMSTFVHFVNVGQGNMTLLRLANGQVILYDCNVTTENEDYVVAYLLKYLNWDSSIDIFINSHRDADHMRGVKTIHEYFPIKRVWDSGVTGTSPDSAEYKDYMSLRREVGFEEVQRRTYYDKGNVRLRIMNSKNPDLPNNPNAQSIVINAVHRHPVTAQYLSSVMLTGDSDAATWKNIQTHYEKSALSCDILLASHHGAITFFDDPADTESYYISHLTTMKPAMAIISVGEDNQYDHPHEKSIELYDEYCKGSKKGNKIKRTDEHGSLILELKDDGGWSLNNDG